MSALILPNLCVPEQVTPPVVFEGVSLPPSSAGSLPVRSYFEPAPDRFFTRAKITHYQEGGFDLSVREVRVIDLEPGDEDRLKIALARRAVRKAVEDRTDTDRERAAIRAKSQVRKWCRQIGADHMWTFSTKEQSNTRESLYEELEEFFRRLERILGRPFPRVVVLERHPKALLDGRDHWHAHVAVAGRQHVNLTRPLWCAVRGGKGMGNIDMQDFGRRVRGLPPEFRSMKIATYMTKYLVKAFDDYTLADKKRWSRSRFVPLAVSSFILKAAKKAGRVKDSFDWSPVLDELKSMLGVDVDRHGMVCAGFGSPEKVQLARWCLYWFPDGSGFFFQQPSGWSQPPPPF